MNAPLPQPVPEPEVIIRRAKSKGHGAHHGGAWKVAYADFVTAMMAFFLMMWLLGATDDNQRKGIADYFSPSIINNERSSGSNGLLGGRSLETPDGAAPHSARSAIELQASLPHGAAPRPPTDDGTFEKLEKEIKERLEADPGLKPLAENLRMTITEEGLRIELIDQENYSMFQLGTDRMDPRARAMLGVVADAVQGMDNRLAIRGHTDALPFALAADGQKPVFNNWTLSTQRAEATRAALARRGLDDRRFARLEGLADTEPFLAENPRDPRNRRMSVTVLR